MTGDWRLFATTSSRPTKTSPATTTTTSSAPTRTTPKANATRLQNPAVDGRSRGRVKQPAAYDLEDLLKAFTLEERVYRHALRRSVVDGDSVARHSARQDLINRLEPTSKAKFVEFTTLLDPKQMPGQRGSILPWPYVEGLRMDEAMHPLTLLATGLYGKPLPNQNGAPIRLVVPWKYGFKGVKSIVKIRFVEKQPRTTWNIAAPERVRLLRQRESRGRSPALEPGDASAGSGEFFKRKTLMFNGYADQVAVVVQRHGSPPRTSDRPSVTRVQLITRVVKPALYVAALLPLAWLLVSRC